MIELTKKLMIVKYLLFKMLGYLICKRAIYTGLSMCHGTACYLTDKPELYGPTALLYAILAARG